MNIKEEDYIKKIELILNDFQKEIKYIHNYHKYYTIEQMMIVIELRCQALITYCRALRDKLENG